MNLQMITGAFVTALVCSWAVAALVLKTRDLAGHRKKWIFCALLLPAIGLRLYTATLGNNYDLYSWAITSDLLRHGHSVYAGTGRYNYGPVWAYLLRACDLLSGDKSSSDLTAFHIYIASLLSLVDAAIACFLMRSHGFVPALVYLFCPVSVITSGYHAQFDNLAVLLGLLSWRLVQRRKVLSLPWLFAAAGLMGLSLAVKHIFFLFPMWLAFAGRWRRKADALVFAGMSYAVFCFSFTPWLFDQASRAGVMAHVFSYRSEEQNSLFRLLVSLVVPGTAADTSFWWSPVFSGGQSLFVLAMLGMMVPVTFFKKNLFHYYLFAVLIFSSALAEQYFVIPLVACCVYYRSMPLRIYMGVASFIAFVSPNELGELPALAGLRSLSEAYPLHCHHAVFWLLVFVVARCVVWLRRAALVSAQGKSGRLSGGDNTFASQMVNLCWGRKRFKTGALLATMILLATSMLTYPSYRSNRAKMRESVLRQIAEARAHMAIAYLRNGNTKSAKDLIGRALSIDKRSPVVLALAGEVFLAAGEVDKGLGLAKEALSHANDQQVFSSLGMLYYRRGDYREAAQCFERALLLAPADAIILNNLGVCYMALGLTQEAEPFLQRALAIDPSLAAARKNAELLPSSLKRKEPAEK